MAPEKNSLRPEVMLPVARSRNPIWLTLILPFGLFTVMTSLGLAMRQAEQRNRAERAYRYQQFQLQHQRFLQKQHAQQDRMNQPSLSVEPTHQAAQPVNHSHRNCTSQ